MGMSEREHHIKVLEKLLKETKGKIELYSENKNIDLRKEKEIVEALGYAISSLKTDLKYDLLYEGEEVYTKDEVVSMLEELKKEIEELDFFEGEKPINITQELMDEVKSWEYGVKDCKKLIQSRIDKLKEHNE